MNDSLELDSIASDRFRVTDTLGTGGMGTVYRARQTSLDRDVALKVLHSDMAFSAKARRRFGREARAVARVNHPHIATVYDFGTDDDGRTLWLAMELVEGGSLKDQLEAPAEPIQLLSLTDQILSALSAAHARGIVHRDLKPSNVLIGADEQGRDVIKLVDFGLAASQYGDLDLTDAPGGIGAEISEGEGGLMGTPRYMAPELLLRGEVDPRVDLYALGVMLFEKLTGHPPYQGEEAKEVIRGHLESAVPRLGEVADRVPAELEEIVRTLLQKDPNDRYESAADVREDTRTVLNELSYGPWVVLGPSMQPGTPDPTASKPGNFQAWEDEGGQTRPPASFREVGADNELGAHQDAPLTGRDSERRALQSLVSQTLRNADGRVALITGEEGVGKSRLVEWIEIRVREAGLMQVARGNSSEAPSALSGVREAIADLLDLHELAGERLRHELESRLERAGLSDDEQVRLKRFLQPQFGSDLSEPSVDDLEEGEQQREQLFAAIEHLFRKMASRRPVMLVLEDIARGDEALASFLEHFAVGLKLSPYPLMLMATARESALADTPALAQTLQNILNLAPDSVHRIELDRLSEEASLELVQSLAPVDDELGRRIARRGSGNPMLLHQLVQFLQEEERLERRNGRLHLKEAGDLDEAIPGEVAELVRSRIESIDSKAARQILDRAAVLGTSFSYSLLRRMLDEEDDEGLVHSCDAAISELVSAGILREVGGAHEDSLVFDHGLMRDVVRREIDRPMPWRNLHRAAGRAKQSFWSDRIEDHSLEIADHFREARDRRGHCRFLARAARSAARGSEPARAIELYEQALQVRRDLERESDRAGAEVPSVSEIQLDLGNLMRRTNDYDQAQEYYRDVLDSDDLASVARARWGLGLVAEHRGAFDDAEGWYEAASRAGRRARSEGMTDEAEAIDGFCLLGLGNIARQRGRFETASRLLFAALERAEESGRTRLRINALRALSDVLWRIGENDEAEASLKQAMDLAEQSGEKRLVAENRMHAALLYAEAGEPQRGRSEAEDAVELFEELNERHAAAKARRVIGEIDWRRGEFRKAAKMLRQAMKHYRHFGDRRGIARCRHLMAQVALTVGQPDQVEKLGSKAMKAYRKMDDKRGIIQCGMLFGRLARKLDRLEDAESTFARAAEGFEQLGDVRGRLNARALQALALEEQGAYEDVDVLLEELLAEPLVGDLAEEPLSTAFGELAELSAERNESRANRLHDIAAATRLRLGRGERT